MKWGERVIKVMLRCGLIIGWSSSGLSFETTWAGFPNNVIVLRNIVVSPEDDQNLLLYDRSHQVALPFIFWLSSDLLIKWLDALHGSDLKTVQKWCGHCKSFREKHIVHCRHNVGSDILCNTWMLDFIISKIVFVSEVTCLGRAKSKCLRRVRRHQGVYEGTCAQTPHQLLCGLTPPAFRP